MLKKLSVSLVVWLFIAGMVSMVHATQMSGIASWNGGKEYIDTSEIGKHNYMTGFQFSTREDIEVTALGYYDHKPNGFENNANVHVYLWEEDRTLLGSAAVTSSDYLFGNFRYVDLNSPIRLHADTMYRIGAFVLSTTWLNSVKVEDIRTSTAIIYEAGVYSMPIDFEYMPKIVFPASFTDPTNNSISTNFLYETNFSPELTSFEKRNSVPEPATMLLLGSSLVGLSGFRKRFKK